MSIALRGLSQKDILILRHTIAHPSRTPTTIVKAWGVGSTLRHEITMSQSASQRIRVEAPELGRADLIRRAIRCLPDRVRPRQHAGLARRERGELHPSRASRRRGVRAAHASEDNRATCSRAGRELGVGCPSGVHSDR